MGGWVGRAQRKHRTNRETRLGDGGGVGGCSTELRGAEEGLLLHRESPTASPQPPLIAGIHRAEGPTNPKLQP